MSTAPPLAYIYDRCVTDNTAMMELRLRACGEYVAEQGWRWGGWFVDKGDDALTNERRPGFDNMLNAMGAATGERVCLLYDWGRLSHDAQQQRTFAHRVLLTGGWLQTTGGDMVRSDGSRNGRLTAAPEVFL
jgi:DNA invertase Pin-like site-specific DNA recombinase